MDPDDTTRTINVRADFSNYDRAFEKARISGEQFTRTLTRAFTGLIVKSKSLGDTLKSLALRLSELALRAALKPLESLFSGAVSGLAGAATPTAFANGGVIAGGLPVPFASGGVVASPTYFPMQGGRVGLMGERGAEAIMPLSRGPDGRLGVRAAGGGTAATITFNVTTPDAESFRQSEAQITSMLARAVGRGSRHL
jgi:phage-related minor tail protein